MPGSTTVRGTAGTCIPATGSGAAHGVTGTPARVARDGGAAAAAPGKPAATAHSTTAGTNRTFRPRCRRAQPPGRGSRMDPPRDRRSTPAHSLIPAGSQAGRRRKFNPVAGCDRRQLVPTSLGRGHRSEPPACGRGQPPRAQHHLPREPAHYRWRPAPQRHSSRAAELPGRNRHETEADLPGTGCCCRIRQGRLGGSGQLSGPDSVLLVRLGARRPDRSPRIVGARLVADGRIRWAPVLCHRVLGAGRRWPGVKRPGFGGVSTEPAVGASLWPVT